MEPRRKGQTLRFVNGYRVAEDVQYANPLNRSHKWDGRVQDVGPTPPFAVHEATRGLSEAPNGNSGNISTAGQSGRGVPNWITYDRKILVFGAYFREDVPYSPLESWRVRKVAIRYYMETDQVEVVEMREPNSGLPQGVLLKRHSALKEDGSPLRWPDLRVGGSLVLFRRTYHLVAVDGATRVFYAEQGAEQPPDEPYPEGPYDQHRKALDASARGVGRRPPTRGPLGPGAGPPLPTDPADSYELAISPRGPAAMFELLQVAPTPEQEARDTAVLRFCAAWDNTAALFGQVLPFSLAYYVADGTVEVREVARRNSGRDPFPLLLSRRRLPKTTPPVLGRPMSPATRKELNIPYYDWRDLYLGATVNVYGRQMLLYDCDDATLGWLKKHVPELSREQLTPRHVDFDPFGPKRPPLSIPPNTSGIGSEEDSLQNVLRLVPKPVHRSYADYLNKWNKVLRFAAVMVPAGPGRPLVGPHDAERRFIVSFHPVDGTLSVWEPKQSNSGMEQGTFLERNRVPNPATGQPYGEEDMQVGAVLDVYGRCFQLLDADVFTLLYMEQHAYKFPFADYERVLSKLTQWLALYPEELPDRLRADLMVAEGQGGAGGYISKYVLYDLLTGLGCDLSPHEVITLVRQLGADQQGLLPEQLLAALGLAPPPETPAAEPTPPRERQQEEPTRRPAAVPFPAQGLRPGAWPPYHRVVWGPDAPQAKPALAAANSGAATYRGPGPVPGHPRVDLPPSHHAAYSGAVGGKHSGGGGVDDRQSSRDTPDKSWRGFLSHRSQSAFGSKWTAAGSTSAGPQGGAQSLGTPDLVTPSALGGGGGSGSQRGLGGSFLTAGVKQPSSLWQTTNMAFGGVGHSASYSRPYQR